MPTLADLLDAADEEQTPTLGAKLDAADRETPTAPAVPAKPANWWDRASTGLMDPIYGAGQLMQNILPESVTNTARIAAQSLVGAVPGVPRDVLDAIGAPQPKEVMNQLTGEREGAYQAQRKAAGDEGLDWWRIGGNVANPMTWLGPEKAAGAANLTWEAVKAGAKSGAFQALLQPVTDSNNFLWSKGMQMLTGLGLGGALGGTLQLLAKPLGAVVEKARNAGSGVADQVSQAEQATDDLLKAAGVDPAKMDGNLYANIQREVKEAIEAGVNPDPRVITNRADAAALPVPMQLTRGQATRDPMQFSWEVNNAKLRGAGEPLTTMLSQQNRQLIDNLNALGAEGASSPFNVSQKVIEQIESIDQAAKAQVDAAYKAVRDAAGRPARVSTDEFSAKAKDLLTGGRPELADLVSLGDYLPPTIAKQYNDIVQGKLPLTVDTVQFLDRAWGGVQRKAADDTTKTAIGNLRDALNQASVSDALGEESMAAYRAARELARQRFATKNAIPAYKAVIDDAVEPDRFFTKYISGANAADVTKLTKLVGDDTTKQLQRTMIAELKSKAIGAASDENGVFSQAGYNKVLQDPVAAPRLAALFDSDRGTLGQLYRVGRVSENIIKAPPVHSINTSNSAVTGANIVRDLAKDQAEGLLSKMFPVVGGLRNIGEEYTAKKAASEALKQAINPGVTRTPILKQGPSIGRLSDLAGRAATAAVLVDQDKKKRGDEVSN